MIRLLTPRAYARSVLAVTPVSLRAAGIRGLILDLDNTLVPFGSEAISEALRAWLAALAGEGIRAVVVSNSLPRRVAALSTLLGVPAVRGLKPATPPLRRALALLGTPPHETALVGDQVFTDVLGGNLLGLYTILVEPLSATDFVGTRLARAAERWLLPRLRRRSREF